VRYTARCGTEALVSQITAVYDALIVEVERYGGSLMGFAGDQINCWFRRRRCSPR